jgi:hypothetical protein
MSNNNNNNNNDNNSILYLLVCRTEQPMANYRVSIIIIIIIIIIQPLKNSYIGLLSVLYNISLSLYEPEALNS